MGDGKYMFYYTLAMISDGTLVTYWRANYRLVIKPKFSKKSRLTLAKAEEYGRD